MLKLQAHEAHDGAESEGRSLGVFASSALQTFYFLCPISTLSHHAFLKTNEIISSAQCNLISLQLNGDAMHCEQTLSSAEFRNCP